MARRTHRVCRCRLDCAGVMGQRGGSGEASGQRRPAVGKTARWSRRAVACSGSSKVEGTKRGGEAPMDVKHTTRGAELTG
jgi:hypothetical protein